jgi:hypothetical protein
MRRYLAKKHARIARRKLFEQRMEHAGPPRWCYTAFLRARRFQPDLAWDDHVFMHNTELFGAEKALRLHNSRRQSRAALEVDAAMIRQAATSSAGVVVSEDKFTNLKPARQPRQSWLTGTIKKLKVTQAQRNEAAVQLQRLWRGHRARKRAQLRRQFLIAQRYAAEHKR